MSHVKLGALAVAAFLFSIPANAADISRPVYKAPAAAPVSAYNWSGFYLGGHAGWVGGRSHVDGTDGSFDNDGPQAFSLKPSNWMYGGQVGYNWQASNWVFGVEAELGNLNLKKDAIVTDDDLFSVKYGRYYTVTGRLGWAFDRSLVYAKGGYVNARIRSNAGDLDDGDIDRDDFVSVSKNRGGWTLGGGLEYGLTQNWSVKAEYAYMKFSNVTVQNFDENTYTFSDKVHTVKFGLNYRFDLGKAPVMAKY